MTAGLNELYKRYLTDPSADNADLLFAEVNRYAYLVCVKRGVNPGDATDTAQDAALAIWTKLPSYDPTRSSFRTFTHRCTLDQVSINRRNAQRHSQPIEVTAPPTFNEADPRTIQAIRSAAGDNIELVDLLRVHGDIATVAKLLGITPKAAQRRLERIARKINLAERGKAFDEMP